MGREARRVPMEFDWPLGEVWDGYLMPKRLAEKPCEECNGQGYSPQAKHLHDQWYGNAPFDPTTTGSEQYTEHTPEVRARAERNAQADPDYYGRHAVDGEARRLAAHYNRCWLYHLSQDDVDALVADGRLRDLTHTFEPDRDPRWQPIDPPATITAAEVNRWALNGMGHDSINAWVVIRARCARLGVPETCATCDGHGSTERWPGQRDEAEAWERTEPPTGDGWQLWETTSEGSPKTPVFATAEDLAEHCETAGVSWFGNTTATSEQWLATFVGDGFVHVQVAPGVMIL